MKALLVILALVLLAAIGVALLGVFLADAGSPLAKPKVLSIRLDQPLPDYSPVPHVPFLEIEPPLTLATLYRALDRARNDDALRGVVLYVQSARFGLAKAQQLRRQLAALSASDKFVECYLETAGEGSNGTLAYYLASVCDRIALSPAGLDEGKGGYEYFPKPTGLNDYLLGSQRLLLPFRLQDLDLLLVPKTPGLLELPDDLRQLNRPF
jgi:protease-4